ncbi:MAG: SH3 domain-containing protein [Anaeromyxobacter sp.]
MRPLSAVAALALLAACNRTPPAPAAGEPAAPSPSGPASGAAPAADQGAYVVSVTVLRREASEAQKVPGPSGKEVGNYLATLNRGEKVSPLELREDWARVRASDDKEGWLKRSALLEGEGISEATVLVQADVFDRPEMLAANAKKKIEPGTLVLVIRARPPFSEVNVAGSQTAWVLSERLNTGEREVQVSKLIEKARYLVRANRKEEALSLLALAREHFNGVALVDVLATELGEVPPAVDAVAVPAVGEAPAAPAPTDAPQAQ